MYCLSSLLIVNLLERMNNLHADGMNIFFRRELQENLVRSHSAGDHVFTSNSLSLFLILIILDFSRQIVEDMSS